MPALLHERNQVAFLDHNPTALVLPTQPEMRQHAFRTELVNQADRHPETLGDLLNFKQRHNSRRLTLLCIEEVFEHGWWPVANPPSKLNDWLTPLCLRERYNPHQDNERDVKVR
jgi:hypothetical protein